MVNYKVADIFDDNFKLVLNAGSNHGIKEGDHFLIYELSDHEIFDPDTNRSLGKLEIVKGTGKVIHVQYEICTIESDKYELSHPTKKMITNKSLFYGGDIIEEQTPIKKHIPFDSPKVGDFAKKI